MARYTLIIKDNKTGKGEYFETNAIIGGVKNEKEGGVSEIFITECNMLDIAETIMVARNAVKTAERNCPIAALLAKKALEAEEKEGGKNERL